jgi:dTDP-4-amino-4,6-dideoxygalactose transaminase
VLDVLSNGQFVLGKAVADFESQFANYCNSEYAIAVNSGTSALHLCLLAAGIGPGDEVITVSMTFVATVAAILYTGAKPVFVDVDPVTWNMDSQQLEHAITPRTKAIIPVHLHGLMADMDSICQIAKSHGIMVIEDACQAHGATYKDMRAGSMGTMNAFSFYPGKNLGAYGEGGAITTSDPNLAKQLRMWRDWGQETKYQHKFNAYNYRMETIQGAVLSVKMKYIEEWTEKRRQVAQWYFERLGGNPLLKLPNPPKHCRHVYHVFAIRTQQRKQIQEQLAQRGIGTNIHYPTPVHLQEAYSDLGYERNSLPITERLAMEFLSLPMFPELTELQVNHICENLVEILANLIPTSA